MNKSKQFTVMLLSENSGKHISVKVGLFTLLTAAVFIVCLIGATAVSINGYLEVFQQNKSFKHLVKEIKSNHLTRLAKKQTTPLMSLVFMDMVSAYRRLKDHTLNIAEVLAGEK